MKNLTRTLGRERVTHLTEYATRIIDFALDVAEQRASTSAHLRHRLDGRNFGTSAQDLP